MAASRSPAGGSCAFSRSYTRMKEEERETHIYTYSELEYSPYGARRTNSLGFSPPFSYTQPPFPLIVSVRANFLPGKVIPLCAPQQRIRARALAHVYTRISIYAGT